MNAVKRFFIENWMKMLRFALGAEAKISHLNAGEREKLLLLRLVFWVKANLSNGQLMKKVGEDW